MIDKELQQKELDKIQDDWIGTRVPYNSSWLSAFKRAIPASERAWDSDDKIWYVSPDYAPETERLTKRYFTTKAGVSWTEAWSYLHLRQDAPSYLIEAAYSCLMQNENRDEARLKIEAARELLLSL